MNRYQQHLCRYYLPKALRRPCPDRVPRTGDDGKAVNCFSVAFDRDNEPYLWVESFVGSHITCKEWDGESYSQERIVALADLPAKDLSVVHYYGLATVKYTGVTDFVAGLCFKKEYLKIHAYWTISWFDQYFFNKKKLVTRQRMGLVRFLWEQKLNGRDEVDAFHLMGKLYGLKWILHPEGQDQKQKVHAFLDSLADTGELIKTNEGKFRITGYALKSVEEYEEQERRHTDNVKIQRWALALTLAIVLLTATQADLVKVPTFLDLTSP